MVQTYKRRMGWTFPWASSHGSDFNFDLNASFTKEQQQEGASYNNYRRDDPVMRAGMAKTPAPGPAEIAAMTGTDLATYTREREGMSAFALEDGVIYSTYSAFARGWTASGHVPLARPHSQGAQRYRRLASPPRRVRQGLSDVWL